MILKNDKLQVKINDLGAELKSVLYNDIEYLWNSDPKYWSRSSPVLFPIVGRLLDNEYIYEDQNYSMTQHGFARDMVFEVESYCDDEVVYSLSYNDETLKKYPFKFLLKIGYKLVDNEVVVSWNVENVDEKLMYFQIGAHPAFNFGVGSLIQVQKDTKIHDLNKSPYVHSVIDAFVGDIEVFDHTFENDAIVLEHIDKVVLKDKDKSVEIECVDFPYIGLWSKITEDKMAPFICLEPWHGIADSIQHNKRLVDKVGMNELKPKNSFNVSYKIKVK